MSNFANRCVTVALAVLLVGCSPQWSAPIYQENPVMPNWIAGLWLDKAGDRIVRLRERDHDFELLYADENFVFLGSALITAHDDELFINVDVKNGKYISGGPAQYPGKTPLSGYLVSFIESTGRDEMRVSQIDYQKLFSGLNDSGARVGIDRCKMRPLVDRALRNLPKEFFGSPSMLCDQLSTHAFQEGSAGPMEKSSTFVEFVRAKQQQ